MLHLLIHQPLAIEQAADRTVFGGRPSAPSGRLMWPHCRGCGAAMQFLGQLRIDAEESGPELLLLFLCADRPGMCRQELADGGGNAVRVVEARRLQLVDPPPGSRTLRATRYAATVLTTDEAPDYPSALMGWAESGRDTRQLLGQIGGTAHWEEADETPACGTCGQKMRFAALLEQGPERRTQMNFGGGWACVFRCTCAARTAKLLLQC